MNNLSILFQLLRCIIRNEIKTFSEKSRFKIFVVTSFGLFFWAGLFFLFLKGFIFFGKHIPPSFHDLVIDYLFSVFYFSLFAMLIFSSLIIAFSVFFQNKETHYLMTCPIAPENIFLYKFFETFLFASWAVLFLGIPVGLAYGIQQQVSLVFYPLLILSFLPYIILPCVIGSLCAFLVVLYISKFRRFLGFLFVCFLLFATCYLAYSIMNLREDTSTYTAGWLFGLLDYLNFTRGSLLPSIWMSHTMLAAAHRDYGEFIFQFALLTSSALALVTINYWLAHYRYFKAWSIMHSTKRKKKIWKLEFLSKFLRIFFFLKVRARLFLEKDLKIFIRDPIQWTQFAILFGLLLLYILNLRTLQYDQRTVFWKQMVATLNLMATALTASTFASRFVFPMLSLEGKRFWTLGVMPIQRKSILYAKFTFAVTCMFIMSQSLVFLSSFMLRLSWQVMALHSVTMIAVVMGVAGLSVGLGAIYPNFREDNPSKIVSGFGGTLNLMLNIVFVITIIVLQLTPLYLILKKQASPYIFYTLGAVGLIVSAIACILPMYLGIRKFTKMEI